MSARWKLVPVEPTPQMYGEGFDTCGDAATIWDAMLAAAPPASQDEELVEMVFRMISPLASLPALDMEGVVLRNEIRAKSRAILTLLEGRQ